MRKIFGKIHLWLSIPIGLLLSLICFTGGLLVFEKEITQWYHSDVYKVSKVGHSVLPADSLVKIAAKALQTPQYASKDGKPVSITGVTIDANAEKAVIINLSAPKGAGLAIDQYTGEIKGETGRTSFYRIVFRLHRWLLMSKPADGSFYWGKAIMNYSVLLMFLILVTGILIWIPKKWAALSQRLKISTGKGTRRFWYDWHVAGGFYAWLFLMVFTITGLCYAFSWWRSGLYATLGIQTEQRNSNKDNEKNSDKSSQKGDESVANQLVTIPNARVWQRVIDQLTAKGESFEQITLKESEAALSLGGWGNMRAANTYTFDNATGIIEKTIVYTHQLADKKAGGWIYSLHTGAWGGWLSKLLSLIAVLIGGTLPLTGYYIWLKKKLGVRKK